MNLLTRQQAMEYLHISSKKMWQLTRDRKISFHQDCPNGKMLFSEADLERYVESTKVSAPVVKAYDTLRKKRISA